MSALSSVMVVFGLCVAAAAATVALVSYIARRDRASLRAKLVALVIGLAGAEASSFPALFVAVAGEDTLGLAATGFEPWLVAALYAGLTFYVIARLFPWHEVNAMAAEPDASLRNIMARLKEARNRPDDAQ